MMPTWPVKSDSWKGSVGWLSFRPRTVLNVAMSAS